MKDQLQAFTRRKVLGWRVFAAGEGWEASEAVLQKGEGGETSSGMINTDLLKKRPQSL